jgi:hypothetical protein
MFKKVDSIPDMDLPVDHMSRQVVRHDDSRSKNKSKMSDVVILDEEDEYYE